MTDCVCIYFLHFIGTMEKYIYYYVFFNMALVNVTMQ